MARAAGDLEDRNLLGMDPLRSLACSSSVECFVGGATAISPSGRSRAAIAAFMS